MTIDHIKPVSLGGSKLSIHNKQLMCAPCNVRKGNKQTTKWLRLPLPGEVLVDGKFYGYYPPGWSSDIEHQIIVPSLTMPSVLNGNLPGKKAVK